MASKNVLEITDFNFDRDVAGAPGPVLVDFTAAWCAPCRVLSPIVDSLADQFAGQVRVGKCDVESNPALAARFDVRTLPTVLLFKNGQVAGQLVGAVPRARL